MRSTWEGHPRHLSRKHGREHTRGVSVSRFAARIELEQLVFDVKRTLTENLVEALRLHGEDALLEHFAHENNVAAMTHVRMAADDVPVPSLGRWEDIEPAPTRPLTDDEFAAYAFAWHNRDT